MDLYGESESYDTLLGAPASGIFEIQDQILLPANQTWALLYSIRILTFSGCAGAVDTGERFVHFNLKPVPELTTLSLFPWAALALGISRRGRRTRFQ